MFPTRRQVGCLLWLVLAAGAFAQDKADAPTAPEPPLYQRAPDAIAAPDQAGGTMTPDTRPLTGAQTLTLGTSDMPSFFVPKLHFAQTVDSNPNVFVPDSDVGTVSSITGELELQHVSRSREFTMRYQGGGMFNAYGSNVAILGGRSSSFQRLGLTQKLDFGRWSLFFSDEAGYTSSSAFGGGANAGAAVIGPAALAGGINLAGLNPNLVPAQNLLTQIGSQVSNTAVVETDYRLNARSTVTVTGNYGILRSPDGNLVDSNQEGVNVGYNRNLTARDTVGITYGFTQFGYVDVDNRTRNHTAQLLYGRRITGRLSLQVGAGGGITQVHSAVQSQNLTLWDAQANLHYLVHHTDFTASYARSVNSGSGVLLGANSDVVSGGFSRSFLRRWLTSTTVGYSRNSALIAGDTYSTFYANSGVQRRLGLYNGVFASYSFQRQTGLSVFCPACTDQSIRHIVTLGFDLGFRSIRME
ncbi:MAG: hypothetical protein WCC59_15500 [Terriglobales bacterium]